MSDVISPTLDELILPDTPARIKASYHTLAERASQQDFGLLEEDVVVLDTETTGLSFKNCELIEIAAARLNGRNVVDRFHTFVHPGKPIPEQIKQLTGIKNADVIDAPTPKKAVAELAEFVGGVPVLAHNATFDRTFIEKVKGGVNVSENWIDTLALSRIALPRLSSHRLSDMAQAFGCAAVSHRAMDDVDALAGMWRIILCALSDMPAGLMNVLANMHEDVYWQFRPIFTHLALKNPEATFSMEQVRRDLLDATDDQQHEDAAELDWPPVAPSSEEVADAFAPGGIVQKMYDCFECRPEQLQMAEEVRKAQATSTHRCIEAGTGVGKSIAYLLPSVLYAQKNNVTVGIATKTNALTDQLVSHELPALDRALPQGLTFFSLKGYEHYPCLLRVMRAITGELPLEQVEEKNKSTNTIEQDMLTALAVVLAYACQSPSGDLDALGIRWRSVPRQMITTTSEECQKTRCPFFSKGCLVHGARRREACADIVVTNHSLLLRNVEAEGNVLPPIRHWIVDEAHSFEGEARRQWAREASSQTTRAAFEALGGTRTGALHLLMVQASSVEAATTLQGILTKTASAASRAQLACAELFEEVGDFVSLKAAGRRNSYEAVTVWIGPEERSHEAWERVFEAGLTAIRSLEETVKCLGEASALAVETVKEAVVDLGEHKAVFERLLEGVRLVIEGTDDSYVYSAQVTRSRNRNSNEALIAEKIDVGAELAERWLPEMMSVVFTSATIAVGDDFSHFKHAVGLDRLSSSLYSSIRLDSSFDYDSNMRVVIARDLPQPNDNQYLDELEKLLLDVHVSMGGSVLTLFTNRREMERTYEKLKPLLAEKGLDLAMHERGAGVRQIRDRFLAEKSLSLFALKAFWEGFDAAGDTLRCVVIPKLPFSSPTDPLSLERDRREQRAWWRYSLPEAVLSVKQAAGRLIRSSTDKGILVLADSRLVTKSYGRQFINSLPSSNVTILEEGHVKRFIESWRRNTH